MSKLAPVVLTAAAGVILAGAFGLTFTTTLALELAGWGLYGILRWAL